MINIKRLVFLCCSFFASHNAFAKDVCSENRLVIPKVTWDIEQVTVITNKTVRDLEAQIKNTSYKRVVSELSAPVGLFSKDMSVLITPRVYQYNNGKGQGCYSLNSIDVKISFKPVIYITLEAMQFACTKARVYEHELNHYNIEILALNRIPTFLKESGYKNYMKINSLPIMSKERFKKELGSILQVGTSDILNLMETSTIPEHKKLDTKENYKYEMDKCSQKENQLLSDLIKNGGALHQRKKMEDNTKVANDVLNTDVRKITPHTNITLNKNVNSSNMSNEIKFPKTVNNNNLQSDTYQDNKLPIKQEIQNIFK